MHIPGHFLDQAKYLGSNLILNVALVQATLLMGLNAPIG
jgi:hypothetical protein